MHEIGIHIDHNIDDFKPPFLTDMGSDEPLANIATAAHVDALTACLTSIHKTFDIFCSMDWKMFHSIPTIHFVRTSYACVALSKLASVTTRKGTRLANIFNPEDLMVEQSLDKLIQHLNLAGENDASRVSSKFTIVIGMVKAWYVRRGRAIKLPRFYQPRGTSPGPEPASQTSTSNDSQKGVSYRIT